MFLFLLNPYRQISGQYHELCHDRFLPKPLRVHQFYHNVFRSFKFYFIDNVLKYKPLKINNTFMKCLRRFKHLPSLLTHLLFSRRNNDCGQTVKTL